MTTVPPPRPGADRARRDARLREALPGASGASDLWLAFGVPALYAVFAAAWIALSDRFVAARVHSVAQQAIWSTWKGFGFVVCTTALLYGGLRVWLRHQRQLRRQLALDEEHLRLFVRYTPAAVAMFDRELRYILSSERYASDFGLDERELRGRLHYEVFPEIPDRWKEIHRRCLAGESAACEEDPFPRADGSVDWVHWEIHPWRDGSGAVGGIVLFSEIVTRTKEEKQRTERALRAELAAKDQLAKLALSVPGAIYSLRRRPDGSICLPFATPVYDELFGVSRESLAADASPVLAHVDPEDLAQMGASIEESARALSPWHTCFRYAHPSRGERWIEAWSVPQRESDGAVLWHGFAMDVTDRRRSEAAVQEREALYRTLFNLTPSGVVLLDEAGNVVAFNAHAHRQLGYAPEAFARLNVSDLDVELSDPAQVRDELAHIAARGEEQFESRHRTATGEVRDVLVTIRLVEVDGKRHFLAVWQDVTERRHAAEALTRSEGRFRALIEKSSDMILVVDRDGRYLFWSPSAVETLGWTAEEKLGRSALESMHPDDRERIGAVIQRLSAQPGLVSQDRLRYQHKDGSWRELEATARNLLEDPAVRGIVVNSRDVTQQQLLQDQYRQAQKLESVGRLAGGIAHDFNNILTVILSCCDELLADGALAPAVWREDAQEIRSAARRASDLTRQLLAFARKQMIAPVALDLNELVHGAEKLLRRLLGEDIELVVRPSSGLWNVRCDPGQLEQVILNLAVNARDAMPDGGTFVLETANVHVDEGEATTLRADHPPGDWVRLVVRDSGCGMSEEVRSHLFEPFFTTKRPGYGTGLGLATVHGILGQAGGHVHVESAVGQGTCFTVCLPATHDGVRPSAPPEAAARGSGSVLVVEDDPQVRRVTVRALEGAGYTVRAVGGAAEVLALLRAPGSRCDLVITDVVMPGLSGRAVADELAKAWPGVRVLYVSGYTQDAIASRGVLDEGIQFLPKPFTPARLLERVREVLTAER